MITSVPMPDPKQINRDHIDLYNKVQRVPDKKERMALVAEADALLKGLNAAAAVAPLLEQQRLHIYADFWRDFLAEQTDGNSPQETPLLDTSQPSLFPKVQDIKIQSSEMVIYYEDGKQKRGVYLVPDSLITGADMTWRADILPLLKQRLMGGRDLALYGLPGAGKTTLAHTLVSDQEIQQQFPDGILWAQLDAHPDVMKLLKTWAEALGLTSVEVAKTQSLQERSRAIQQKIGLRRMLLVVDNAHKVYDALAFKCGGAFCCHLLTTDYIHVATSFAQEGITTVGGVSIEVGTNLLRAHAPEWVRQHSQYVSDLLNHLDYLPASIILAGNYLKEDPGLTLARLKEKMQEQQQRLLSLPSASAPTSQDGSVSGRLQLQVTTSLQASSLPAEVQHALHALCVYPVRPNTFAAVDACAVIENGLDRQRGVHYLGQLVSAGLLEYEEIMGRYALPKSTFAYHDQLSQVDRAIAEEDKYAQRRYIEHYCKYINVFDPHEPLQRTEPVTFGQIDAEFNNILGALHRAAELTQLDTLDLVQTIHLQRLLCEGTIAVFAYFRIRGMYTRAEQLLLKASSAAKRLEETPYSDYAMALNDKSVSLRISLSLAEIAEKFGKNMDAEEWLSSCLKRLGNPHNETARELKADALYMLGVVKCNVGEYTLAEAQLKQSQSVALVLRDTIRQSRILMRLGVVETNWGRWAQAKSYDDTGLQLLRAESVTEENPLYDAVQSGLAGHLLNLGVLQTIEKNYAYAEAILSQAWEKAYAARDSEKKAGVRHAQGEVARLQKAYADAHAYLQEGLKYALDSGYNWYISLMYTEQGNTYFDQNDISQAETAYMQALKAARSRDVVAFAYWGLAKVEFARKQSEEALRQGITSRDLLHAMRHFKSKYVSKWLMETFPERMSVQEDMQGGPESGVTERKENDLA